MNLCAGCDGGDYNLVFSIYGMNSKFMSAKSYPYKAKDGTCTYEKSEGIFETKGSGTPKPKSVSALKAALD